VWTPGRKIAELVRLRRNLRYWIGVPVSQPIRWSEVFRVDSEGIATVSGEHCRLDEVQAWFAACSNDDLLEMEGRLQLPPGIHGLTVRRLPTPERVAKADLVKRAAHLRVTHGPCALPWRDPRHFSTELLNVGREDIRVTAFGAYSRLRPGNWASSTAPFSSLQFRSWYDVGLEEWIPPNGRAWDPANWSDRGMLWAYRFETRSGGRFVAGEVIR